MAISQNTESFSSLQVSKLCTAVLSKAAILLAVLLTIGGSVTFGQVQTSENPVKLGQAGMKFLEVSIHPSATGVAHTLTAQERGSESLFYNPASMARLEPSAHMSLGQNRWIGGINHNYASIAYKPGTGNYGVVGASVMAIDYGDVQATIHANNRKGYRDIGTISPTGLALGVGYARAVTDRFSVGGQIKYVRQSLGSSTISVSDGGGLQQRNYAVGTLAGDFGVLYHTGFRSLKFGASFRNFSQELTYAEESFELPLTLELGTSMDLVDVLPVSSERHAFIVSFDATHPRDYVEQLGIGGEYVLMETVALRAGYEFPTDEAGVNLGAGINTDIQDVRFGFDYAFTQYSVFNSVHQLSLTLGLN